MDLDFAIQLGRDGIIHAKGIPAQHKTEKDGFPDTAIRWTFYLNASTSALTFSVNLGLHCTNAVRGAGLATYVIALDLGSS